MRVVLPNSAELATDWTVARDQVKADLDKLASTVNTVWDKEHTSNGGHGDIAPSSVTLQNAAVGEITTLAYDSARFFSTGISVWTVDADDLIYLRYSRIGQLAFVQFQIEKSTIATDTSSELFIRLPELHAKPNRLSAGDAFQAGGFFEWADTDGSGIGSVVVIPQDFANATPSTIISLTKMHTVAGAASAFRNWQIGANNVSAAGYVWFVTEPNNIAVPYFGS